MNPTVHKANAMGTETLPPGLPTELKRPPAKYLRSFRRWMIGDDTIGTLLDNAWSLGVCCRGCPRTIEMKPEAIEERFGAHRRTKLADLQPRLICSAPNGCGSNDMVLFPWRPLPASPPSIDLPLEEGLAPRLV